jgi:uncharacterized protein (TIGR02246 family)
MDLATEDILEIHQLYAAYNFAVDDSDGGGFAATFTPDGTLVVPAGEPVSGSAALAEFASRPRSMRHVANNIALEADGAGARGRAYLQLFTIGEEGSRLQTTGRYSDQLERVDGRWRFARREFNVDQPT